MNLTAARTDVVDALNAVPGIRATVRYRTVTRAGDALVRFDNAARDTTGFGWILTLQALITLPQDTAAAEKWIDDNVDAVLDALAGVVVVLEVAPVQLALDSGLVPALQITGTRAD